MKNNFIQHNYLSVPLPDDWNDTTQVRARGPEDSGFQPNLVFSEEATRPGETAADFAARQLPALREVLPGYVVQREGEARLGPNSGFLREHTFEMDGRLISQFQFYVILGGRCYTFTFTHLKERFSSVRGIAEKMFSQARLTPRAAAAHDDDF